MKPSLFLRPLLLILPLLLLLGCSSPSPEPPTPTLPLPSSTEIVQTAAPSETPSPSPTPSPGLTVLVAPPDSDQGLVEVLQETLAELAAEAGLEFQLLQSLSPGDLDPNVRILVALPPDPGLQNLAAAAPETQFVALQIPGLAAGGNLSVISGQGSGLDQQGFVAGYIAALVTPDWRVGAITTSEGSAGTARQGFLNGVVFFCGLCRPTYPPYFTYPTYAELSAGAGSSDWQSAIDTLKSSSVQTIYLAPGLGDADILSDIAMDGVNLIGSASPPAALKERWIATLSSDLDPALRQLWPDLLAGKGGVEISPSLSISDVNPDLLSPGRLRLVDELLNNLQAGFIDTGVSSANPTVP